MNPGPDGTDHLHDGEDLPPSADCDLKEILARTIKRERKLLGLSQGELAERSGVHRTYVSDLERGARNPTVEIVAKLAQALGTSVAKLFEAE